MRSIPFLSFIIVSLAAFSARAASPARFLVQDGQANCVIVAAEDAGSFYNFAAHELQRYLGLLSGATPEIIRPSEISKSEKRILLLLGGPQANSLVRESVSSRQVDFSNLAKDGFLLWDVRVGGRSAVVIGGNDDASTMYAAYDFIERLGVTFLLARDIVPEKTPHLELPALEVRAETPFPRRGFFISNIFPNRGIMHLSEVKFMLDQMAKLKMNYLQFFWFAHEPWIRYGYQGEEKLLGDATGKETGYLTWTYNYGSYLIKDLEVGRDLFNGRRRMAPAEFQNVENPEDAYRVAKEFLAEIIRYAKTRKIDVWLAIDPTTLPGNLARLATRAPNLQLPFHPILGAHMCPADPVLHEINANRLQALVETYPEAEGYFLYIPEMFPDCNDERDRRLLLEERKNYDGLIKLWKPYTGYERDPSVVLDSTSSSIYIVKKMLEARQREAPNAKLGIGGIGRAFLLPFMDKLFPKDVPFTDMESSGVWTPTGVPMEYFGGMGERERTLVPRVDDDSSMFGMQFNVNLFYNDRLLEGSVENGVAGFAGQLNRIRGTEQNYRYLSEGAYHPKLKPREFYASYARRLFGEAVEDNLVKAFDILEENEQHLGWYDTTDFNCCGVLPEISAAYRLYRQPNPFDGPKDFDRFTRRSHDLVRRLSRSLEYFGIALTHLKAAESGVAPHGKQELQYIINKIESHQMLFRTLITLREAYIALDEAFRLRPNLPRAEFAAKLDAALGLFHQGRLLGRQTTETFAAVVDHPSDLGVLYRANLFLITGLELVEATIENIVNFHHGRPYTQPVAWDKIYREFPRFDPPY